MQDFFEITVTLARILLGIAVILGFIKYKQISVNEKWYLFYLIFIFFIEYFSYGKSILKLNIGNAFLYPVYIAGEFFTITGIFIKKLKLSNYYFIIIALLCLFFLTADKLLFQYQYNNDYSKALSNLIIVGFAGYSLLQEIKSGTGKDNFLTVDKMIFLYFTVSIFIFMFQHQLLEFPIDYFSVFWIINNLMSCVLYSLFIKAFLQLKK